MLYKLEFIVALLIFLILIIKFSKNVKTKDTFLLGKRDFDAKNVSYVIVGTLVGGASTVGTVQMAFLYGLPAIIFTFGSGVACLILGLFFSRALRESEVVTVSEFIGRSFGESVRKYSSFLSSSGIFIHIVAQYLASAAIISSVLNISFKISLIITLFLLVCMVIFGGIVSSAYIGKIKFYILYLLMICSTLIVLYKSHFFKDVLNNLPKGRDWFGFADYGYKKGWVDFLSMVIGVISTQTYLQAIFSAKNVKEARKGAFISAAVIPPIGFMGGIVGLYLRAYHPEIRSLSAKALPFFISNYFPGWLGVILNAFLLVIVLGTGAGLALGVSTNLYNDIFRKKEGINYLRWITFLAIFGAFLIVLSGGARKILDWSFLSMGLRGFTVFLPLLYLLFFNKLDNLFFKNLIKLMIYVLPIAYIVMNL